LENTTGWFCIFFCILVPDFQKWTRGWLSGLFLNLSFLCILYF
jgi:hypothetical protein